MSSVLIQIFLNKSLLGAGRKEVLMDKALIKSVDVKAIGPFAEKTAITFYK
jgi:hypothetical protein